MAPLVGQSEAKTLVAAALNTEPRRMCLGERLPPDGGGRLQGRESPPFPAQLSSEASFVCGGLGGPCGLWESHDPSHHLWAGCRAETKELAFLEGLQVYGEAPAQALRAEGKNETSWDGVPVDWSWVWGASFQPANAQGSLSSSLVSERGCRVSQVGNRVTQLASALVHAAPNQDQDRRAHEKCFTPRVPSTAPPPPTPDSEGAALWQNPPTPQEGHTGLTGSPVQMAWLSGRMKLRPPAALCPGVLVEAGHAAAEESPPFP